MTPCSCALVSELALVERQCLTESSDICFSAAAPPENKAVVPGIFFIKTAPLRAPFLFGARGALKMWLESIRVPLLRTLRA